MSCPPDLDIFVYTGDRKYAGTDNNVHIILYDVNKKASKTIHLNNAFRNNFERGQIDCFRVSQDDVKDLNRSVQIESVEIWKDYTLGLFSSDWFVDKIVVENCATNSYFTFPFFRWIKSGYHYRIQRYDTSLPQNDEFPDQRAKEIEEQKQAYEYDQKVANGPVQVKKLPPDEQFSFDYKWDMMKTKMSLLTAIKFGRFGKSKWHTIEDMMDIFSESVFSKPDGADRWHCDVEFGRLRMNGVNPVLIQLFTKVPENFPVTDDLLQGLLESFTLQDAIDKKKLFFIDLNILDGLHTTPGTTLCSPIALFFVNKDKQLVPVAIQLFQSPADDNPIFTPKDDQMTWNFVKMWYSNADSGYHQSLTHLGFTHMLMEGVSIATNRNLSRSHPIFKILAPHFLYIIAINSRALAFLVSPGGWVDRTMAYGAKGLLELTVKGFDQWRMDVDGSIHESLRQRGVEDPNVLPGYYFRDDAVLLYDAIFQYAKSYIDLYYGNADELKGDWELQSWAKELVKSRSKITGLGAGILGVPGGGSITNKEDLVKIVTSIIYVCSVAHASANFGQYNEYAFPPCYPSTMKGKPPTSKETKFTEKEIVDSLVDKRQTLDILTVTTILSRQPTNSLGDFEVQYIFDPKGLKIVEQFRKDLEAISEKIKTRNEWLEVPYDDLLPEKVPNSISI